MKFTVLINSYSPKYMWLQCWIFTGLQSGEVNIYCQPPTLTEVNSCSSLYSNSETKETQKDDFNTFIPAGITILSGTNLHSLLRSEQERTIGQEFEWPIRLHLKCYPIFQHISVPDIHISYPQTAWSSILHIGATNGGSVPQFLIKSIFHLHDSF